MPRMVQKQILNKDKIPHLAMVQTWRKSQRYLMSAMHTMTLIIQGWKNHFRTT